MDVLTNKQYRNYDKLSRYSVFPIYFNKLDNKWLTGTTAYLRNDTPYKNYTVKSGDTYDTLALKYYNNPTLYWVICSFNFIANPFESPTVGSVIKIPTLSSIEFEV